MAPVTQTRPDERRAPAPARTGGSNKLRKLMVEKVRRERINHSIAQLRALLHQPEPSGGRQGQPPPPRPPPPPPPPPPCRLEKADVLEMAVRLLRARAATRVGPSYSRGFSQCLQETLRHLSLHAALQPAEREEIKRFYVLQRAALQRHVTGERSRRTVARKRSASRSSARSHGSLWRPW